MLNPFPDLLTYGLLGPLLIRLALGIYLLALGSFKFKGDQAPLLSFFDSLSLRPAIYYIRGLGILEMLAGLALVLGLQTQIAAIIIAILAFVSIIVSVRNPEARLEKPSLYALLFVLALSLITTGAGFFAIDLPL